MGASGSGLDDLIGDDLTEHVMIEDFPERFGMQGPNEEPLPGRDDERSPGEVAEKWRDAPDRDADGDDVETDDVLPSEEEIFPIVYGEHPDSENILGDDIDTDLELDPVSDSIDEDFRLTQPHERGG